LLKVCWTQPSYQLIFGGEGIVLAHYLQNQSYAYMLRRQVVIPYECWRGKNQSLYHFKMFDCITYASESNDTQWKLEPK
jgi:hypothetical protein